uniref:Inner centromere protein ARK-binding domain-containing protein n=1 Tax=Gadus morhua TaxID=8049 RepID=A0A8C5ACY9_GADMO
MSFRFSILQSLKELSDRKLQQFMSNIDDVHGVWLQEIKREADRVLTGDLSAPPELMPKTPSQKRGRKKRVSQGSECETFSKGKRSIIRGSTVKPLDLITEDEGILQASTSGQVVEQPKRSTRRRKQTVPEVGPEVAEQVPEPKACSSIPTPREIPAPTVSVRISFTDRRSAELVAQCVASPGRNSTRIVMAGTPSRAQRSSNVRLSSKLRYSKAVLRHSMMRRTSRRTILKKKSTRVGNTTCSSNARGESCCQMCLENHSVFTDDIHYLGVKRKSPDIQEDSPNKKLSPTRKSILVRLKCVCMSFLQSTQKKQRLMRTPTSGGRNTVIKSFIKHTTPLQINAKSKELLEALKKKQEQEEENMKKMEEEKRRKQEEQKRKRDERLRRVVDARMKEDEEKKKRIEEKLSWTEEKSKKMAGEKAKKKIAVKHQEEVEQKRRLEEKARLAKIQKDVRLSVIRRLNGVNVFLPNLILSPQSYRITPKGGNKTLIKSNNAEDYGMDQNSDDSTDDEMAPRKAVPSWAEGLNLHDAIAKQYFNPPDLHTYFGVCEPPKLEVIFSKSKPRYFQRTSSAVWHSPPRHGHY